VGKFRTAPRKADPEVVALYHLDGDPLDVTGRQRDLKIMGTASFASDNLAWMAVPKGQAVRVRSLGDGVKLEFPAADLLRDTKTASITLEAMLYINEYVGYGITNVSLVSLLQRWNARLELSKDKWSREPRILGGQEVLLNEAALRPLFTLKEWHRLALTLGRSGYVISLDDKVVARRRSRDLSNWTAEPSLMLEIGNFDGWIDEIMLKGTDK
jgi:hypothetical protein